MISLTKQIFFFLFFPAGRQRPGTPLVPHRRRAVLRQHEHEAVAHKHRDGRCRPGEHGSEGIRAHMGATKISAAGGGKKIFQEGGLQKMT